jgi:hypothetical protein
MVPNTAWSAAPTTLTSPEEAFWDKYNKRLEFPLSTVAAILLHVLIGAVIVFGIFRLMNSKSDRAAVVLQAADIVGFDDGGRGAPNQGGEPDPAIRRPDGGALMKSPTPVEPKSLPEIKIDIRKRIEHTDPDGKLPISDSNAARLADLHKSILDKFLGAPRGSGPGDRSGGTGADSTLGRNLRWVLRFKVQGGRDYVDQLRSMGAVLVFPRPEDGKQLVYYSIGNSLPGAPRDGGLADDAFTNVLAGKIRFSDARRDAVQGVAGAVGLDFTPRTFWAFFPKDLEEKLARLETGYRNKRSEDIEETIFRVTMRGGSYDVIVDEQKMKR